MLCVITKIEREKMKTAAIIVGIMACILTASTSYGSAVQRKTYPIAEKDALLEIKERASKVDWKKYLSKEAQEEKINSFKPKGLVKLPAAKKNRARSVDMTYSLEFDIPDGKGGILYPRGYTFNPMDYVRFQGMMVVIDGTSKEQVDWFKNSKYFNNYNVKLLLTDGNYYKIQNQLNQNVYYAFPDMIKRFKVACVPSVIWQKEGDRNMSILEVMI